MAIVIAPHFTVPDYELAWKFTTSGGPGGQHANKAATRVEASFDIAESTSISEYHRRLMTERFGDSISVVVDDERSQLRNRQICLLYTSPSPRDS